jgi:nucleoid DNA-binding protein
MNKMQLTEDIADRMNTDNKTSEKFIEAFIDTIYESLRIRESITIAGFGTFYIKEHSQGAAFKFNLPKKCVVY